MFETGWVARRRHEIVDIALVLKASLQIDMVMFWVIFNSYFHSFLKTNHYRQLAYCLRIWRGGLGGGLGPRLGFKLLMLAIVYTYN